MSGFKLDAEGALSSLRMMLGETTHQREHHTAAPPVYPAAAAGRDFSALGGEVATMLGALHRSVDKRLEAVEATTGAATRQVKHFVEVDHTFAEELGAVDGEGR